MRVFVTADPHFGHKGVVHFEHFDGKEKKPLRPYSTVEEMDEALIENWNSVVNQEDKVYVLGDFCINRKALPTALRLNGDKILIKGNHDIFKLQEYIDAGFRDIRAYHVLPAQRVILSHIPVHTSQLERWRMNIHGHLHANVVTKQEPVQAGEDEKGIYVAYRDIVDTRYKCVSVEHTDFKPVLLDSLL